MFKIKHTTSVESSSLFKKENLKFIETEARLGILVTAHGKVETPAFMPVATKGTVKLLTSQDLKELDVQAIIVNSFLLSLQPGREVFKKVGGLHKFMDWDKTIFADSGGFQIIRQGFFLGVDNHGVYFKSPYHGKKTHLTPEDVIDINIFLGSDVVMCLDHVPEAGAEKEKVSEATKRTLLWAERSLNYFKAKKEEGILNQRHLLFCITQGGIYPDLRRECTERLKKFDFDGYGIGGLSIGEDKRDMFKMLWISSEHLPRHKIRYFMGVGKPEDIIKSVALGVDIFDSVFPTRNARHNTVFARKGNYNIRSKKFALDERPLEEDCQCYTCQHFSRAYISHLCRAEEYVWMRLVTIHNIFYIKKLMAQIRKAIREDAFEELARDYGVV